MNLSRGVSFESLSIKLIQEGEMRQTTSLKGLDVINESPEKWIFSHWGRDLDETGRLVAVFKNKRTLYVKSIHCPFGSVGDKLFIIESPKMSLQIDDIKIEKTAAVTPWFWLITFHLL